MLMFIYLTILFIVQPFIYCNIWDNIYSNLNSPQFIIPNETRLELYDKDQAKKGEVLVSSHLNRIKFSIIDYNLTHMNSSIIDVYFNFQNSTISFDYKEKCVYRLLSNLNFFNVKFIINAYDLLTFYRDIGEYYEYTFSNPLAKRNITNTNKSRDELNNNEDRGNTINLAQDFFNVMEEDMFIKFRVNKTSLMVETMDVKLFDWYLKDMKTKSFSVEQFNSTDFTQRHSTCDKLDDTAGSEDKLVPSLQFLS